MLNQQINKELFMFGEILSKCHVDRPPTLPYKPWKFGVLEFEWFRFEKKQKGGFKNKKTRLVRGLAPRLKKNRKSKVKIDYFPR